MNQWLAKRYEVYAKRDFAYMARMKKELESENGCMELLYSENTLAGIKARWGMEKPEERMLFCEEVMQETQEKQFPVSWAGL